MNRRLPCPKCPDGAWLKNATGATVIPYEMGLAPSAFRTPGEVFRYDCQRCGKKHTISKQGFYALPDLDAPKPAA